MGTRYQHLSKEERDMIAVYKAQGCSRREIGIGIGRDKASIFPGWDDWQILRGGIYWLIAIILLIATKGRLGCNGTEKIEKNA